MKPRWTFSRNFIQMHARSGQDGHSTTGQSRFSNKNDVPQRLTRQFDPTIFAPSSVILIFIRKLKKKQLEHVALRKYVLFQLPYWQKPSANVSKKVYTGCAKDKFLSVLICSLPVAVCCNMFVIHTSFIICQYLLIIYYDDNLLKSKQQS